MTTQRHAAASARPTEGVLPAVSEAEGTGTEDRLVREEMEPVPRDSLVDEVQYEVLQVTGNKLNPCQYLINWSDGTNSWQPVTQLFGTAEKIVEYWESATGRNRARNIGAQKAMLGPVVPGFTGSSSTSLTTWQYQDWVRRVTHGTGSVASEIAYVVGVQLTKAGHPTQNSWVQQLRKGSFVASARFTVWVIPQYLCTLRGSAVVPLLDVRYEALGRMVSGAEWQVVSTQLVHYYRALAQGVDVPFFWWHEEEQDEKWQLIRDGVLDTLPLDSVLGP